MAHRVPRDPVTHPTTEPRDESIPHESTGSQISRLNQPFLDPPPTQRPTWDHSEATEVGFEMGVHRSGNPALMEIEDRASQIIKEKRRNDPANVASLSMTQTIYSAELSPVVGRLVVQDVREDLQTHCHIACSVCRMIAGKKHPDHPESGSKCTTVRLGEGNTDWAKFKEMLQFPPHIMCWTCLMPTVGEIWFESIDTC